MKISKDNKSTFFLTRLSAEQYLRGHNKTTERFGKMMIDYLKKNNFRSGSILDIGSGSGLYASMLINAFPDSTVTGLDYSELMIDYADKFIKEKELNHKVSFTKGDMMNIPFDDNSFDVITSINTLHFATDLVAAMNEMQRVLKKDGMIAVTDIRTCLLSLFVSPFSVTYSFKEFRKAFNNSKIASCSLKKAFIWIEIKTIEKK